jgi:glycosyltransferase involved in cell wall biosynthesis
MARRSDSKKSIKKNIVWMHSHFLYWMGGTKYVFEVLKRLNKEFDITVIVENVSDLAKENYKKESIKLISLNKTTSTSSHYWITLPFQIRKTTVLVDNQLKKLKIPSDTILVSNMFPMNVVASRLPYKHVQYCFEPFAFFHDPDFISNFDFLKRMFIKLVSYLYKNLDIEAAKKANKMITLNNTTAKYIEEIYSQKPAISYTGIDTKHFKPYVSKNLTDKYKNKKVIIHSTDYTPVKGTDRMIKIFADVKKKEKSSHLLITSTIKNESVESDLKKLAKSLGVEKDIEFLGFVDYDLLPQYYSLAKVLVQCSFSERSGTTSMALPVKEAMAAGTLAIRYPVKNEDVVDGITGYLVDPRDKRKMVKKILTILNMNNSGYNSAVKKARRYVVNKYTWDNTAKIIGNELRKT